MNWLISKIYAEFLNIYKRQNNSVGKKKDKRDEKQVREEQIEMASEWKESLKLIKEVHITN